MATDRDERSQGEFLRETREARKMSLRAVARGADISAPFLSDVEHGRREVSEEVAVRLGKVLDVTALDIRKRSLSSVANRKFWEDHPDLLREVRAAQCRCRCPHCLVLR